MNFCVWDHRCECASQENLSGAAYDVVVIDIADGSIAEKREAQTLAICGNVR
jgi:hypothetical protein